MEVHLPKEDQEGHHLVRMVLTVTTTKGIKVDINNSLEDTVDMDNKGKVHHQTTLVSRPDFTSTLVLKLW